MTVHRDAKGLEKILVSFGKTYKENRALAHDLAVSVLFHTAAHRQLDQKTRTDKLHRFYDILKKADQDAFRQWASAHVTLRETDRNGKSTVKRWLTGGKDDAGLFVFKIVEGTKILSDAFAGDIERIDALPSFFDHEPSSRPAGFSFGEQELMRALEGLLKKAEKGKEANQLSPTILSALEDAKVMVESRIKKEHSATIVGQAKPVSSGADNDQGGQGPDTETEAEKEPIEEAA